jgi:pimeloyl-ACP methyl ester carboxylesterase
MRPLSPFLLTLVALAAGLSGCVTLGHASNPIPTRFVPAPDPAPQRTLVVVLPGIGSDARDLDRHQVAQAIQREWPDADTMLTGAALAYYAAGGGLVQRVHEEIIEPARDQGYTHIWLIGASLGGLGALLYEQQHPGELSGVVAFAPFLGDEKLPEQIRAAGGIGNWPGPLHPIPQQVKNPYTGYPWLIWTMARNWLFRPEQARRIWIVCGNEDNLRPDVELLASALPEAHYVEVEGGHRWSVWLSSLDATFRRIRDASHRTAQS